MDLILTTCRGSGSTHAWGTRPTARGALGWLGWAGWAAALLQVALQRTGNLPERCPEDRPCQHTPRLITCSKLAVNMWSFLLASKLRKAHHPAVVHCLDPGAAATKVRP